MSLDDPKAWRSTVDKSTGHVYYYHKKTRVSQWVKPDCIVAEEEREREAEAAFARNREEAEAIKRNSPIAQKATHAPVIHTAGVDFSSYGYDESGMNAELDELDMDEEAVYDEYAAYDTYEAAAASAEAAMNAAKAATSGSKVRSPSSQIHSSFSPPEEITTTVPSSSSEELDPAAASMISQLVEQIALGSPEQTVEALELLLSCCIPATVDAISEEEGVLSTICGAVLRCKDHIQRRLALKCLWCLSTGERASSVSFISDQSWVGLGSQVHLWGDDIESLLIYSSMLGLLLGCREARSVIDVERASHLAELVIQIAQEEVLLDMNTLCSHPADEGLTLLDARILQAQAPGTAGHPLSSSVVVALSAQCLGQPDHAVHFLQGGGISSLQRIHSSSWAGIELRMEARRQLLRYMEGSAYARECCLDALLAFGCSHGRIPVPEGRDPLERKSGFNDYDDEQNEEQRLLDGASIQEQLELGLISEAEYFDLDESSALPRDVVWRPRSGCAWKVSSILLWTHCPALRPTLENLWESEDGGELELGTNTSSTALSCVVRYLHSGAFVPLKDFYSSLELVKLALELGAQSLVTASCTAVISSLTSHTAETVLTFAQNMNLPELEDKTSRYINGDKTALKCITYFIPGSNDFREKNTVETGMGGFASRSEPGSGSKIRGDSPSLQRKNNKPQSGGIYGLLLQEQDEEKVQSSQSNVGKKRNGVVPGRTVGAVSAGKAAFGRGVPGVKSAPGPGGKKPAGSGQNILHASEFLNEYTPEMSLEPKKVDPKTAVKAAATPSTSKVVTSDREKRLAEMSKPKEQSVKEKLAERKEAREKLLKRQKERSEQVKAQRERETSKGDVDKPVDTRTGFSGGGDSVPSPKMKMPTRSDSPEPESYNDDVLKEPDAPAIDPNVRRSLASLKNKAAARQRRSVSDSQDKFDLTLNDAQNSHEGAIPVQPLSSSGDSNTCTRQSGCDCAECSAFSVGGKHIPMESDDKAPEEVVDLRAIASSSPYSGADAALPYEPAPYHNLDSPLQAYDGVMDTEEDRDPLESSAESLLETSWEEADAYPQGSPEQLHECGQCGRRFRAAALERHAVSCGKMRKRKPLDMTKQRLNQEERDLASHLAKQAKNDVRKKNNSIKSNDGQKWKKDSETFREAMRAGKETTTSLRDGTPLPEYRPSGPDPSLIPCPHCNRRFNANAAERHIPKCQNIKSKPSVLKAGSGRGIGTPNNKSGQSKGGFF